MIRPIEIECTCPFCGQTHIVTVEEMDYLFWEATDTPVQKVFPYLSADEREMLISGICPTCWEKTFGQGLTSNPYCGIIITERRTEEPKENRNEDLENSRTA